MTTPCTGHCTASPPMQRGRTAQAHDARQPRRLRQRPPAALGPLPGPLLRCADDSPHRPADLRDPSRGRGLARHRSGPTWCAAPGAPPSWARHPGRLRADHLAIRVDLAPKTRQLYDGSPAHCWIDHALELPARRGRRGRTINLGADELGALTVASVREWYAAAMHTADAARQRARTSAHAPAQQREAAHARPVLGTGHGHHGQRHRPAPRSRPRRLEAAGAAGSSPALELPPAAASANAGRARVAQAYRLPAHASCSRPSATAGSTPTPARSPAPAQPSSPERVPATPDADRRPRRGHAADDRPPLSRSPPGPDCAPASFRPRPPSRRPRRRHRPRRTRRHLPAPARRPFLGPTKTDSSRRTVHLPPTSSTPCQRTWTTTPARGPDALVFADERGRIAPARAPPARLRRARTDRPARPRPGTTCATPAPPSPPRPAPASASCSTDSATPPSAPR